MQEVIDLRSDTVTHPTEEMRRAMFSAVVGDDVYGEDPTVNDLEQKAARLLRKESALFTASGTMSNLLAVLAQTQRGDEVVVGSEAHMFWYEVGGASALGGVMVRTVPNEPNGTMNLVGIDEAIRSQNIHYPRSALLCLENTHNRCGAAVLRPDYTGAAARIAHQHSMKVHLDGARIFNASVALGIQAWELAKDADSVSFCLSKGLSAPVGSLLCGDRSMVDRARKWRKMVGGGMRQVGVLASAGIVALDTMVERLAEDHVNARALGDGLSLIPGITVTSPVQTNTVMFAVGNEMKGDQFLKDMDSRRVRLSHRGGRRFRAVTHCMVTPEHVSEAVNRISSYVKNYVRSSS